MFGPGEGTEDVTTWEGAKAFCREKRGGGRLATQREWCAKKTGPGSLFGNLELTGDEWAPIWESRYNDNEWLQLGTWNNGDVASTCMTYDELYDIDEYVPIPTEPPLGVLCEQPSDCNGNVCTYSCELDDGYYPDSADCTARCHCEGGVGTWEKTVEEGIVWDPYCLNSDTLSNKHIPLSGTTGGCFHEARYVADNGYCTSDVPQTNRRLEEDVPTASPTIPVDPDFGTDPGKSPGESNYILCQRWYPVPDPPATCATVWGDPHIVSWDGLHFSAQGQGEFTLVKSLQSGLLMEARFERFEELQVTVTRAVKFTSPNADEPTVEVVMNGCRREYYVDGEYLKLDTLWQQLATDAAQHEKLKFRALRGDKRTFYFVDSGIQITVRRRRSTTMGCYLDVTICIPDDLKTEQIVGLLGTPNGDDTDDWVDETGLILPQGDLIWEDAFVYAKNWCIEGGSSFASDCGDACGHCDEEYDSTLEEQMKNVSPELLAVCGNNPACLIEGTLGDLDDAADSVVVLSEAAPELVISPIPIDGGNGGGGSGSIIGDPHIKTWTGEKYDYHGICDLVMLQNSDFESGLGMDIHIRTKRTMSWSYISSAVLRIGEETLEIMGGYEDKYWINGVEGGDLRELSGFAVVHRVENSNIREFRVELNYEGYLHFKTFKEMIMVSFENASTGNFGSSRGLLGSFGEGEKYARDSLTVMEDVNEFGQEWQVRADEDKLFHNSEGPQAPDKCEVPSSQALRRRLLDSTMTVEDAHAACFGVHLEDFGNCLFDVLTTNDVEIAGAYLL